MHVRVRARACRRTRMDAQMRVHMHVHAHTQNRARARVCDPRPLPPHWRAITFVHTQGGGETSEEDGDAELEDGLEDGEGLVGDDAVSSLMEGHRQRRRRAGRLQARRQRRRARAECEVGVLGALRSVEGYALHGGW